jgi:hypothetical protein
MSFLSIGSSFSEGVPDLAAVFSLVLGLQGPIMSRIDADHVRMLMGLFSVEFRLLAHGAGPEMVVFRKNDISLAGRLFLLGIGPSHNALNNQQKITFLSTFSASLKLLFILSTMVLLLVVVLYWDRDLFLSLDLERLRFSLLIEVLVKLLI